MITPLAPREPYSDVDEASFNTEIEATCSCAILFRFPLNGAPSTMIRGAAEALIEPTPLILIVGLVPGTPPVFTTLMPGTLPFLPVLRRAVCTLEEATVAKVSCLRLERAPRQHPVALLHPLSHTPRRRR